MAKEIIILSLTAGNQSADQQVTAAFWLPVTAGQQTPQPNAVSVFRGASAAEIAALRAGTVVEQIFSTQYPATFTLAQIEAALQTSYAAALSAFQTKPNPNTYYGAFWDGTTWNAATGLTTGIVLADQFGAALPATSGDNIIIAGAANQVIGIDEMVISAAGTVTVSVKDGSTVIGAFVFGAGGGTYSLPFTGMPWFVTSKGNNFTLNLSAAVQCAISGWFKQA